MSSVSSQPTSELLTVTEVARIFRVDETTVRRWIANGALPSVALPHTGKKCGHRVRSEVVAAIVASGGAQ